MLIKCEVTRMATVTVAGTKLFYAQSGAHGPAVVLVHGAGGNHLMWPAPLRQLPGASVYALDLPGHGSSEGSGRDTISDYVTDVVGFLDALDIKDAVLVGHSMGGAIVQEMLIDLPERVSAAVLLGTGARLRVAPVILEGLKSDFAGTVDRISRWLWGSRADPDVVAAAHRLIVEVGAEVLYDDFAACDKFDVRQQIDRVSAPVLVMTGAEDRMTPPDYGSWIAGNVTGARFVLVEAAGHMLMLEDPRRVAEEIEGFIQQVR